MVDGSLPFRASTVYPCSMITLAISIEEQQCPAKQPGREPKIVAPNVDVCTSFEEGLRHDNETLLKAAA